MRRVLLALLAALLACKPSSRQPHFQLRIALLGPLNPLVPGAEPSWSEYAQPWVYESILRTASDGSPSPGLAARFRFSSPGRVGLVLRQGARFSDGSAVTAADVRRSLQHAGLEVQEQSSELVIESPSGAPIEGILRNEPIYKRVGEDYLGSGPFRVISQKPERILLGRLVPEPGKIDEVVLLGFPTGREPLAHTLAGDADLLIVTDPKQLEFFQGVSRLRVVRMPGASAIAVAMGLKRLDRAARRAIAAALPIESISRLAFGKECVPFSAPPTGKSGDLPARALDVLVLRHDLQLERTALAVSRALGRSSGEVQFISPTEAFRLLKSQDFDLFMVRPLVWPPRAVAGIWASDSPLNQFGYRNPRVDAALKAGEWARALQALRDDAPVAFICSPERIALVDSRVKNPRLGPGNYLETLPDWEVEQ